MTKSHDFQKVQLNFAKHIRDPENTPVLDGIEDRRMGIYRDLFYNNIEGFVANAFPVLRKLYNDTDWHAMVRDFVANHQSHSPYFLEISEEFLKYLQQDRQVQACDPAFILELSHYEWVELALTVADEEHDLKQINPNGDLAAQHPVLSSLAWNLSYQWPVHQLGPDNQPTTPPEQATHIVVYRDRTDTVRFVLVNMVTAVLLEMLEEDQSLSGSEACRRIAEQMQHPNPDVVIQGGLSALEDLRAKGIILGTSM